MYVRKPRYSNLDYVVIDSFPSSRVNGVTSYHKSLLKTVGSLGFRAHYLANDADLPRSKFREEIVRRVCDEFDPATTIIETPELSAVSLCLPEVYAVHVRMHCPAAIVEYYQGKEVDRAKFESQMRCIHAARIASAPSYGLLDELDLGVKAEKIHVYKNPLPFNVRFTPLERKDLDMVFIARFDRAKGTDFLNVVLEKLPSDFRVAILGREARAFEFSPRIKCDFEVYEHRDSPKRLKLLERARVSLLLSRFENCPMLVLESIMAGTAVVAWDVGGIAEMAPPPVLSVAPFGDVETLLGIVNATARGDYPSEDAFKSAARDIDDDFQEGLLKVIALATGDKDVQIFRGMSCRYLHPTIGPDHNQTNQAGFRA